MTASALMLEAIKLNEQAVRSIDTKAQIFIAAILFGANALGSMFALMGGRPLAGPAAPLAWIVFTGLCLLFLIWVVAPVPFSAARPRQSQMMFVARERRLAEIAGLAAALDVLGELAAELHDIEHIRNVKTRRMRLATFVTAALLGGYALQLTYLAIA